MRQDDKRELLVRIDMALEALHSARDWLKLANARRATDKVRRAIKSAEGAKRHASLAPYRKARQEARMDVSDRAEGGGF